MLISIKFKVLTWHEIVIKVYNLYEILFEMKGFYYTMCNLQIFRADKFYMFSFNVKQ
ncbi:MAG: hypothetical protein ACI9VT_002626 [Psychroserpens sp.]|jgi:hypothetical protein